MSTLDLVLSTLFLKGKQEERGWGYERIVWLWRWPNNNPSKKLLFQRHEFWYLELFRAYCNSYRYCYRSLWRKGLLFHLMNRQRLYWNVSTKEYIQNRDPFDETNAWIDMISDDDEWLLIMVVLLKLFVYPFLLIEFWRTLSFGAEVSVVCSDKIMHACMDILKAF